MAPSLYSSKAFQKIFSIVAGSSLAQILPNRFTVTMDALYVMLVSFSFYAESKIYERSALSDAMLNMIFALFLVEFSLKIFVLGPKRFWRRRQNRFDMLLCISTALSVCFGGVQSKSQVGTAIILRRIISVIRAVSFLRNLDFFFPSLGFRNFAHIGKKVLISLATLTVTCTVVVLFFAILGMWIFGGLINRDPHRDEFVKLEDSEFGREDLYSLNFNDLPSSLATLITCLHVSGWDIIADGYNTAIHSPYVRFYFSMWYCIGELLLLNLVRSLFLRGFLLHSGISGDTDFNNVASSAPSEKPDPAAIADNEYILSDSDIITRPKATSRVEKTENFDYDEKFAFTAVERENVGDVSLPEKIYRETIVQDAPLAAAVPVNGAAATAEIPANISLPFFRRYNVNVDRLKDVEEPQRRRMAERLNFLSSDNCGIEDSSFSSYLPPHAI